MHNLFFYQREVTRKVKVEDPQEGEPTEKEVVETYWDCFNVNKVVRGHWTGSNEFTILLDDGHEQSDFQEKPIFSKGKLSRIDRVKERAWFASQIPLNKKDAERFRALTEWTEKEVARWAHEDMGLV